VANQDVDILIIGGGLIGATLMLALRELGYRCALVEHKKYSEHINPDFDARSLALSPASMRILTMLGVWDLLAEYVSPIQNIHVSDQGRFGTSRLQGEHNKPLGYVVEMQYINRAIYQLLDKQKIIAPATLKYLDTTTQQATVMMAEGELCINAKFIVAADGAHSTVRTLCNLPATLGQFHQQGIVANIGLSKKHDGRAFERFTKEGPLALLPMQDNKMSLVWAMSPDKAECLMKVSDEDFLKSLQKAFGYRLGRLTKVGKRFSYPLQQLIMPQQIKWPVVFVGNAAHTLHPVAGQGFNLGIRDVAALAQCIAEYGLNEAMLDQYMNSRRGDQQNIVGFTNGLIKLFTSRIPGVGLARDLGLIVLDNSAFLKKCLSRYAQGYSGIIPDLVCHIPLQVRESNE
jgi:2-octaprenyl-6-methoxyphenol hydroxylase